MQTRNFSRLISISIRGLTLASKFLLIFFLARFLPPVELGIYGLLAATISYSIYFVGFDFYNYTARELLKAGGAGWGWVIKSQGALSLVLYAIFLPLLGLVFVKGFLPFALVGWFFLLLILEHLTQELGRFFVAVSEQVFASFILFFRSGLWAIVITLYMLFEPGVRSLNFVLGAWALGSFCALLLGVYKLARMKISGWEHEVDWVWILKGLKVASLLLISTLAVRGVFTLDRYWFESLVGLEALGAYVLFMGICMALTSFLDAGVFSFAYPELISRYQARDAVGFRRGVRKLLSNTMILVFLFSAISMLLVGGLSSVLGNPVYNAQLGIFPWVLLASVIYSVGMIPHYALYAQGFDRPIIFSHLACLLFFVVSTWCFKQYFPLLAVPLGLCVSFLVVLCWKSWCYYRLTPAQYR